MNTAQPAPARLWLVRHGQTDWNAQRRIQGHTPTELNAAGRRQAEMLAHWFSSRRFGAIWSSDLPRALQTAQAIAAGQACSITTTQQLRERHLGVFEGKTWDEVRAMRADLTNSATNNGDLADWTGVPGVESDAQLWTRTRSVLDAMSSDRPGQDVLAVTHGGVLKHVVWHVLGLPAGAPRRFGLSNGLTAVLEKRGGDYYLLSLLDIEMLTGRPPTADTANAPSA
jgi:probable phosphoglycerate mutase